MYRQWKNLKFLFRFREFNGSDWISFSRIVIVPVIALLCFLNQRQVIAWMLLFGFISDALDGFIARRYHIASERGANLDSVGDAILFLTAVGGLLYFEKQFFINNLVIMGIAVGLYMLQVVIALIKYGRTTSFHTYSAKTAAILQAIFLVSGFFFSPFLWLFWIAISMSILETVEEIALILYLKKWTINVKGFFWLLKKREKSLS